MCVNIFRKKKKKGKQRKKGKKENKKVHHPIVDSSNLFVCRVGISL